MSGFSPAWALSCAEITTKLEQLSQALDGTQTDPIEMMVEVIESSNKDAKAHGTRTEMDIACLTQNNMDIRILDAARKGVETTPEELDPGGELTANAASFFDEVGEESGLGLITGPIGSTGLSSDTSLRGLGTRDSAERTEGGMGHPVEDADTSAAKQGRVSAAGGQAIILGALDKSLIDKVIQQNLAQIRYCYQRALTKDPELKGKVTLNFTISKTGSVAKSSTYKTTLGNATAEACLNQNMMNLQFPEPKGGGIVIVKYPFIFSS